MRIVRRPGLLDCIGVLLVVGLCASNSPLMGDPGVGWHLKSGEWMLRHRTFLYTDPFLFTSKGKPWVHNQWLADVMLSAIYNLGGWSMLAVLLSAVSVLSFVFVIPLSVRRTAGPLTAFAAAIFCLLNGAVQWFLRPVMFSFLFFALLLVWVRWIFSCPPHKLKPRRAVVPFLLFALWANFHPAFILGFAVIGSAAFSSLLDPRHRSPKHFRCFVVSGLLGVLATLINPYGIALYIDMFSLVGSPFFMNLNVEWLRPDFSMLTFVSSLAFTALVLLVLLFITGARALTVFEALLLIVFSWAAFSQRRYIPFYGLAAALPFSTLAASAGAKLSARAPGALRSALSSIADKDRGAPRAVLSITTVVFLLCFSAATRRIPFREADVFSPDTIHPARAAEHIAASGDYGPVFHTPDWGGYLIWKLWPGRKIFIDDRNQLNGEALYREFITVNRVLSGWHGILEKYKFHWALLRPKSELAQRLKSDPEWRLELEDTESLLFHRSPMPHSSG